MSAEDVLSFGAEKALFASPEDLKDAEIPVDVWGERGMLVFCFQPSCFIQLLSANRVDFGYLCYLFFSNLRLFGVSDYSVRD